MSSLTPESETKTESLEIGMSNIEEIPPLNSLADHDNSSPLFVSLVNWVGTEIASTSFGALKPSEDDTIQNFKEMARVVGVASKRRQPIDEDQWNVIKMMIWRLWQIVEFTRELGQKINVKGILIMFATPANHFESPIPEISAKLSERFGSQNWGFPQLIEPQVGKNTTSTRIRAGTPGSASHDVRIRIPPPNHSIFGPNGCMHHIALFETRGYEILCEPGKYDVFGHNGFQVGQCWARQVAAVRDGVHGSRQAGICGTANKGAYSIVIASTYASLDQDTGSQVFYSGAGALVTIDSTPDQSKYTTRALIKSIETGNGIRVLRKHGGEWVGCPKAGLRYDGLYKAVGYTVKENDKGGKFLQFELVRMDGQPDIDMDKPGLAERLSFEKVKDKY
ncbi:hypothetical protein ONS96_014196 [Cadophora gregata f. sp. sojae]|nr:hypothetical protein ONS96_014196 [Cadophora gregata f. sp. sojae]